MQITYQSMQPNKINTMTDIYCVTHLTFVLYYIKDISNLYSRDISCD
jgi:hypothetical protein